MKYAVLILSVLLLFTLSGKPGFCQMAASEGRASITTDNYANRTLNYYYYIPANKKPANQKMPVIVIVPGLSSSGEAMVHPGVKKFAEQEGFIIVAPTFIFDENNWDKQASYQYPAAWSGNALIRIISSLSSKGVTPGNLYMMGFSAGAQFAGRFAILNPHMVSAAMVHASGGPIEPTRYIHTRFLMTVGAKDMDARRAVVQDFMAKAKSYGIKADSKEYANLGHALGIEVYGDMFSFFRKVKQDNKE